MNDGPSVVGIAGTGLIGASIGLRARANGDRVLGWDPSSAHLATARERGAIDRAVASFAALAAAVDVLVLAGPPGAIVAQLADLVASPGRARLVLDVGSVKAAIARAGRPLPAFVATHPLAGSERSGPAYADAGLFAGCVWTYDPSADGRSVAGARAFIASMGARAHAVESWEHDRVIAATSHLPQVASVALGACVARDGDAAQHAALRGPGLASMLRLAQSDPALWTGILFANAANVAQEVRALAAILCTAADAIDARDRASITALFAQASGAAAYVPENQPGIACVTGPSTNSDERI